MNGEGKQHSNIVCVFRWATIRPLIWISPPANASRSANVDVVVVVISTARLQISAASLNANNCRRVEDRAELQTQNASVAVARV